MADKSAEKPEAKAESKPDARMDFKTAMQQVRQMGAVFRSFRDLDIVLTKAAEAEDWMRAAPGKMSDLEGQVKSLIAAKDKATKEGAEAETKLAATLAEVAKAQQNWERRQVDELAAHSEKLTALNKEYERRSDALSEEYRTKDLEAQQTHDQLVSKLSAEAAELERKVTALTKLRDQMKAL